MRRALIGLLVAMLVFAACGGDDNDGSQPADEETETPAAQDEYIIVGGEETAIVESCVDTSGQYVGTLPEGGIFILRDGTAPDESFVDYLPSQDADPLSSQNAKDTTTSTEGSFVTGTTTVTTEDGANDLEIEFGIIIEDSEESCAS